MKDKLKPCPFCGDTDIDEVQEGVLICGGCGAVGDVLNWNNRPAEKPELQFTKNELRIIKRLAKDYVGEFEAAYEMQPILGIAAKCDAILDELLEEAE